MGQEGKINCDRVNAWCIICLGIDMVPLLMLLSPYQSCDKVTHQLPIDDLIPF